MTSERRPCRRCNNLRLEKWMVGDTDSCYFCSEARANADERPIASLLSAIVFRRPKPQPRKVLAIQSESGVR